MITNLGSGMDSFDGDEICKLVSIHILSLLPNKRDKQYTGLYRDDGLALLRNLSTRKDRQNTKRYNRNL